MIRSTERGSFCYKHSTHPYNFLYAFMSAHSNHISLFCSSRTAPLTEMPFDELPSSAPFRHWYCCHRSRWQRPPPYRDRRVARVVFAELLSSTMMCMSYNFNCTLQTDVISSINYGIAVVCVRRFIVCGGHAGVQEWPYMSRDRVDIGRSYIAISVLSFSSQFEQHARTQSVCASSK